MDGLTERAMKLLRECPILIEEAEDGAPIWNSIAGNLLAMGRVVREWRPRSCARGAAADEKGSQWGGSLPFAGASIAVAGSIGPRMKKPALWATAC